MIFKILKYSDWQKIIEYIDKLPGDKKFIAEIKEKREKRTLDQNGLFHVWIKVFAEFTGERSLEACKRDVKRTLLGLKETVNIFTGEIQKEEYHTSEMDTKEMAELMTAFKEWAMSEWGCYLPYWKDAGYDDMINQYS